MDVDALLDAALGGLASMGLDVSVRRERAPHVRADATLALRWGGTRQRLAVHAMESVRLTAVLAAVADTATPVLVVAPWISPKMGEQLRAIGVAYVDGVGNASLRFGTVLIEVSGRKRPPAGGAEARSARTSTTGGPGVRATRLLTPANRSVIAALLDDPSLEVAPLRVLAEAAGVSVGQAHKSVTLLASAGYHREYLDDAQRIALRGVLDVVGALGS